MGRRLWFFFGLLLVPGLVLASESLAISPGDFADTPAAVVSAINSPEAHWIWSLLASDSVYKVLLSILAWAVAAAVGWLKLKGTRSEQCLMFLEAGVRETYEEYVRAIKHAVGSNGKLTDDQRREAVRRAIARGTTYAKEAGLDLGKSFVKQALPVLVDAIVRKMKGEAAASKSPLPTSRPPLPDLAS